LQPGVVCTFVREEKEFPNSREIDLSCIDINWTRATSIMRTLAIATLMGAASVCAIDAHAVCEQGAYRTGRAEIVAIMSQTDASQGQRYLFLDGRRGSTADVGAAVTCTDGSARIVSNPERLPKIPLTITVTTFSSVGTQLTGRLIEPKDVTGSRPLVVMVHGSEKTPALTSPYPYVLAPQGIAVFVYDKRGTGASKGEFTQNFELLAADAAAALSHAQSLARGRISRSGYYGGSQGGWVAPLAATQSTADFVAVGFGLVASPLEEDREEMISEARALGLDSNAIELLNQLSKATSRLLLSRFADGYDELAKVRRQLMQHSWWRSIKGEHSGEILRMSEADLRRLGRARFDNLEIIWDYDSIAMMKRVDVPQLWVLAEEDREAPIESTRSALQQLVRAGKPIELYVFPDTDHGIIEFTTNADGSRTATRVADGYLRLIGDWIKGQVKGDYGRARKISQ
jgi:uncharacterized protein